MFLERSPDDMHRRMAKEFARKEHEYEVKSHMSGQFKFLSKYGK